MNAKIIDFPETQTFEESQAALELIFSEFTEDNDTLGLSAIISALTLPEKEFALLAENILNEQEKALNNVEDKMLMVQALNASGLKAEDLTRVFEDILRQIETDFTGKLSQQKIDFLKRFIGIMTEAINATEGIAKRVVPVAISYDKEGIQQPRYARAGDAALDIYSPEEYDIAPGESICINTGIKVALPLGYMFAIVNRSGQAMKTKLRISNAFGVIDSGYRGSIGVLIENIEPPITDIFKSYNSEGKLIDIEFEYGKTYHIDKGQRIAQMILQEVPFCLFYEIDDVKEIEGDRASRFGATGNF